MKIKACIEFQDYRREFIIPCGTGDKTIKWLGIVASQRYSNAAPNGTLRRRDDFYGGTEFSQYQVDSIILPTGRIAHPGRYINESDLKDGDKVVVRLSSDLSINGRNGMPHQSQWASIAFNTSEVNYNAEIASMQSDRDVDDEDESNQYVEAQSWEDIRKFKEERRKVKADADFMNIVLQSQMVDIEKVYAAVEIHWAKIDGCVPRLKMNEITPIKDILSKYWDLLVELYDHFSDDGTMSHDQFLEFTGEAGFFPVYTSAHQSAKIFTRTTTYVKCEDETLDLSFLLVALLLVAQAKYNDTVEFKSKNIAPADALSGLFKSHLVPLAEKYKLQSVLKSEFCSDECLANIRLVYDDLQNIFTKYAAKLRDVPTTVPIDDIAESLSIADLVCEPDIQAKTKSLLDSVREGTIYGTKMYSESMESQQTESDESNYAERPLADFVNEFCFPEFVEVVARAGFARYYDVDVESLEDDDDGEKMILRSMLKGVKSLVEGNNLNEERLRNKAAAVSKGGRGQRK